MQFQHIKAFLWVHFPNPSIKERGKTDLAGNRWVKSKTQDSF